MAKRDKETKDTDGVDKTAGASSRAEAGTTLTAGRDKPRKKKKKRRVADPEAGARAADEGAATSETSAEELAEQAGATEAASDDERAVDDEEDEGSEGATSEPSDDEDGDEGDADEDEDDEEEVAAAQLGIEKYVMAGFFATGMLVAFLTGRFTHLVWAQLSNRDWFSRALPSAAAVSDDSKLTYGTIFGAVVALIAVIRSYRSPRVRAWTDEVAGELAKVKWPNKKEVTSSTLTVLAASAIATTYLALLDRLWGFVTNLVYGTGT